MAVVVKISHPDGTPWINEVGDSKEDVIRKLQARASGAKLAGAKARLENAIERLQSS
jgi:hypothetical protein